MKPVSAVVFDLDGTLYRQRPVQLAIAWELARSALAGPVEGLRRIRILSAYRRAQEELRNPRKHIADLKRKQLEMAAEYCGVESGEVARITEEWMERKPLPLLGPAMRAGTVRMLERLKSKGLRLGVLSDYPGEAKLEAMGILAWFDVVACAQETQINRFKPDPAGLAVVLGRLGVDPSQAAYVGDRADVDGEAARAAGADGVVLRGNDWEELEVRLALRGMERPPATAPARALALEMQAGMGKPL